MAARLARSVNNGIFSAAPRRSPRLVSSSFPLAGSPSSSTFKLTRPLSGSASSSAPPKQLSHPSDPPPPGAPVDISKFSYLLDSHPEVTDPDGKWAIHFPFDSPLPVDPDFMRAAMSKEAGPAAIIESLPPYTLTEGELNNHLHRYAMVFKRVVNQTGKGKMASIYIMVVVGNGKGMVGYGEGKDVQAPAAGAKAFADAVKNMAPVRLFEGRTIQTELRAKFHATEIVMRPRPPGFGLRCNPNIHQVCKAAGISDISCKVTRSTNPMNVIKLAMKMLHAGSAPSTMGDGFGGKGKRLEKGTGMRTVEELALMRGRRPQEDHGVNYDHF